MNRRAIKRVSVFGLIGIFLFFSLFFTFVPLTQSDIAPDVYFVNENVKLDLPSGEVCNVRVNGPVSLVVSVSGKFVFSPPKPGLYEVSFSGCSTKDSYFFEVIPEFEEGNDSNNDSDVLDTDDSINNSCEAGSLTSCSISISGDVGEEVVSPERLYDVVVGKPVKRVEVLNVSDNDLQVSVPYGSMEVKVYRPALSFNDEKEEVGFHFSRVYSIMSSVAKTEQKIVIANAPREVEVEYYTPAPEKTERNISDVKKEVVVSAPDYLGYKNVLSFSKIDGWVRDRKNLKVYWKEEDKYVDFNVYDSDDDGFLDYIEWIVPHLSTQTFEIILVSGAEHLDSDREVVSDIYDEVWKKDNVWSEEISDGEFVRVVFQENLSRGKDITVFPRIVSGDPKILVYERDSDNVVADFSSINSNVYNKVFLNSNVVSQDSFDLKVVGGSLIFDHIVDPPVDPPVYDTFEVASGWNWTQATGDDCDWSRNANNDGTPSGGTGPEADHTLGTIAGHFLFTEATSGQPCAYDSQPSVAILESPELDADTYNLTLDFWFHMFDSNSGEMGDLYLDVNSSAGWQNIWFQSGQYQTSQTQAYENVNINLGDYSGIIKLRFRGSVGTGYRSDMSIDDLMVTGTFNNLPPSTPTILWCNGGPDCNLTVNSYVGFNCSGSSDVDGDEITYFVESYGAVVNSTYLNDSLVSFPAEPIIGTPVTVWTKETGAGCSSSWTGDSSYTTAQFRAFIDGDKDDFSDYDAIRYEFCAGTDEGLQVLNTSICWIDSASPSANTACTDSLVTNEGNGTTGSWYYTEIGQGSCSYTPWMDYAWSGSRNYFVQWGSQDGVGIDGNRYVSGCSDSELVRQSGTNADVMSATFGSGDSYSNYMYDLNSIQGVLNDQPQNDSNSSSLEYSDVLLDFSSNSNIEVIVEVDSYNPLASLYTGTREPDLFLEIYNGSEWRAVGEFDLNETYVYDILDTTNRNFSLSVSDSDVLTAWQTSSNQDIRIKAVLQDFYNTTLFDEINISSVFVVVGGVSWYEIGNHTNGSVFYWDSRDFDDVVGLDFRCRAVDLDGSELYSDYYQKYSSMDVDHSVPVVNYTTGTPDAGSAIFTDYLFVNLSVNELHPKNVTFYLHNSTSLVNSTSYLMETNVSNNSINFSGLLDGTYFYNASVYDEISFSGWSITRNVSLDLNEPLISFAGANAENVSNFSRGWVYFGVSVVEPYFKNISFAIYNDSGVVNETTYTSLVSAINWTSLADGHYYYNATVYDNANRSNSTDTLWITLDNGVPWGNLTIPYNDTHTNDTSVNFTVNATDSVGLLNLTFFLFNETGLMNQTTIFVEQTTQTIFGLVYEFLYDGIFSWFYAIGDAVGNEYVTENYTVIIDTEAPDIEVLNMMNNSGDRDGVVGFLYNFSDDLSEISECHLILNESDFMMNDSLFQDVVQSFNVSDLGVGRYNWSIRCFDDAGNFYDTSLRFFDVIYSTSFNGITTDLSEVDTSNILNLILERTMYGRIEFNDVVDLSGGVNLNSLVSIDDEFVKIDSASEPRLNKDSTIYMYYLDYVFTPVILRDDVICGSGCLINYYNGNLSFNISGFSNYSLVDNSVLSIWDETDPEGGDEVKYADDDILFFANYTNYSDGESINGSGVYCNISFDDGNFSMVFNSSTGIYEYNRSFSIYGTYDYDVFCNGSTLYSEPLTVSDDVLVTTPFFNGSSKYGYRTQGGQEVISSAQQLIPIDPVSDTSHAFVLPSYYYSTGQNVGGGSISHDNADYTIWLYNESDILVAKDAASEDIYVTWQLLEAYDEEFTVYRGIYDATSSGNDFYIPIGTSVDPSNSMALITGHNSTNTGTANQYDDFMMRAYVYNSTYLRVQRQNSGTDVMISWVVVEWDMDKIDSLQTGSTTVEGSTHTESSHLQVSLGESVDVSDSLMIFQIDTPAAGLDQVSVAGYLSGSDTVDFYASSVGTSSDYTGNRNVRWYVIDFGDDCGFQDRGQIDYSSTANWEDHDELLSQSVNLNNTLSFVSLTHDGTGTAFPRPYPNVHFTDDRTLNIFRTYNGQEAYIEWQVLELPSANNPDYPHFSNPSVNQTYASDGELVKINLSVTDASDEIDYVSGLISDSAYLFENNSNEWYYLWECSESGVVNFTWVSARDNGNPNLWNSTNITDTYFVCDAEIPFLNFTNNTLGNETYSNLSSLFIEMSSSEDNFANVTYELYNDSGIVNLTTYDTLVESINFTGLVTGAYYYNVSMVDLASQENHTETRVVYIDVDNPKLSYTTGTNSNGAVISGEEIYVNVSVVEDYEKNITFNLYDENMIPERSDSFDTPQREILWNNLGDGLYFYQVLVYDIVGRYNETELWNVTLDNSFPVVDYGVNTEVNNSNVSRSWIYVNLSLEVENFGNITYELYNSSGVVNSTTYYTSVSSLNFTNLVDGNYSYNVTVYDAIGRNASTDVLFIRLDTLLPFVDFGIGVEPDSANLSKDWIYVNVSVVEDYEKNITFNLYNSTSIVNSSTFLAGNRSLNFTNLVDGVYKYNVSVYDFAGNLNFTSTRLITLDETAPNGTLLSPPNETYTGDSIQNLTVNVSDNLELENVTLFVYNSSGSLINQTSVVLEGTATALVGIIYEFLYDGLFKWFYAITDIAGNTYATDNNTITVDSYFPLVIYGTGTEADYANFSRDWIFINVTVTEDNFENITFTLTGPENREVSYYDSTWNVNFSSLSDGFYQYYVSVYDKAGHLTTTDIRNIGLDYSAPTVNIINPIAKTYSYNESLPLEHTVVDNVIGVDSCWWNIDNGVNNSITCGEDTTFDTDEGEHTINFYANDSYGYVGMDSVTFSVSVTGPAIVLITPENNSFYSSGGTFVFNFSAEDPDLVDVCSLYGDWNGGWHKNVSAPLPNVTGPLSFFDNFDDGDLGSDWTTYSSNSYSRIDARNDATPHSGSYSVIADSNTNGQNELSELISARDFSGASNIILDFWYVDWSDEDNAGADHDGHTQNGDAVYFTCDGNHWYFLMNLYGTTSWQNVNLNISDDPDFCPEVNSSFAVKFTQYDNYGVTTDGLAWDDIYINYTGSVQSTYGNLSAELSGEGNYLWNIECNDTQSYYTFALYNQTLILDTTTPSIEYGIGTEEDNTNFSRSWIYVNVSVVESNEKNITFALYNDSGAVLNLTTYSTPVREVNWTVSKAGFYYYNVTVVDGASRSNTTFTRRIGVDDTTPFGNLTVPYNNTYSSDSIQNLTVNVSDNLELENVTLFVYNSSGSLINQTSVVLEGTATALVGIIYEFLYDGIFSWFYAITDIAGNTYTTDNNTFIYDSALPFVDFTVGTEIDYENVSRSWIYVNVSVIEDNFKNITFNLYGPSTFSNSYSDGTREINWSGLVDGLYSYNVTVYDLAGQMNYSETRHITIETTPPHIYVVNPLNQNYSVGDFYFNVTLDESGFCNFSYDGGVTNYTMETDDDLHFGYINSSMIDGYYVARFYCEDLFGNLNNSVTRPFQIDGSVPFVGFSLGTEGNNSYFSRSWIYVNVSVIEDNEENITFDIGGPESYKNTYGVGRRSINWTFLDDGVYKYNVSVYDSAGNYNITETRYLTLDNVLPVVDFSTGTEIDYENVSRRWIYVNASVDEPYVSNITFILFDSIGLVNESTYLMESNSSNTSINWSLAFDGVYKYNVSVYDLAGNLGNTSTRYIVVDTAIPYVAFGAGAASNDSEYERDWIYVNVSASDTYLKNFSFELYNSSGLVNQTWVNSSIDSLNWSGLVSSNVTYYYNVSAYDFSGNVNFTETRYINLYDSSAPRLSIVKPENTTYTYNDSIPLIYNVSDANLFSCWYNLDEGTNISLPGCSSDSFDVSDGVYHTLYLYANDSLGQLNSSNVTFLVNTSYIDLTEYIVQRGSAFVDGSTDVPVDEIPQSKSFILHSTRSGDAGPDSLQVTSKFTGNDIVTFENYASGAGADVEWEVISGPGINSQRGEVSYDSANSSFYVDIIGINLSRSFIVVNNRLDSGTGSENEEGFWSGRFYNASRLQFTRGSTGDAGVLSWQVVDWEGATVERKSSTMSATSTSASISPVNLSRAFIMFSRTISGDDSIQDTFVRSYFIDDSNVQFERWANGGTVTLDWFVVSAPFFRVDSGDYTHDTTTSRQYDEIGRTLYNTSRTFNIHTHENAGTGTTYSNGFVSQGIENTTTIGIQKGTANNDGETTWFSVEIVDVTPPTVMLTFPGDYYNFSSYAINDFSYYVNDSSDLSSCLLYGNWSGGWHLNESDFSTTKGARSFSGRSVDYDGYYVWNVLCNDSYGNVGYNSTNFTFSAYLPPEYFVVSNISQSSNDGFGNVTLFWNSSDHSLAYRVYYSDSALGPYVLLNETAELNYTDATANESRRRFYNVSAWNPGSETFFENITGKTVYYLKRMEGVNTRNHMGFYLSNDNFTRANESLLEITNATAFTKWNTTLQRRVTCNEFSCPDFPECTDTNCNFEISDGESYEVYINSSAPTEVNWSFVGFLINQTTLDLVKNASSYGKNWVSMYAGTGLVDAEDLMDSITDVDAITDWNESSQTSVGIIPSPFRWIPYLGTNFELGIEEGYEVSVTSGSSWLQE